GISVSSTGSLFGNAISIRPFSPFLTITLPTAFAQKVISDGTDLVEKITKALAKVACPQKSISFIGEYQRISNTPDELHTIKAVSDKLFSLAMLCISSSESQLSSKTT